MEEVWINVYHWREVIERPVYDGEDVEFNLSDNAWNLITQLITDRKTRLDSLGKVREHAFFSSFKDRNNWNNLRATEEPPFVPQLESDLDTTYFDDFNDPNDLELYKEVQLKQKELDHNNNEAGRSNEPAAEGDAFNRYAFVGFTFRHKDARDWRSDFETFANQARNGGKSSSRNHNLPTNDGAATTLF